MQRASLLALLDRRPGVGPWDESIALQLLELSAECVRRQPQRR